MLFPVSIEKQEDLKFRMRRVGLKEDDLIENFVRGSGSGGQKVNKTSVLVQLKDPATGLEVRCQRSRSQAMNRFLARRMLVEKLEAHLLQKKTEEQKRREKVRRQKRKRSKRAKEKMLENKKHQGEKKKMRQKRNSVVRIQETEY